MLPPDEENTVLLGNWETKAFEYSSWQNSAINQSVVLTAVEHASEHNAQHPGIRRRGQPGHLGAGVST